MYSGEFRPRIPLLTEEELATLEDIGVPIRYTSGSILLGEGEETDFVLLIHKGHVKVVSGRPKRIIEVLGPGEIVGEMAAIRYKPRSASVFALSDVEALHLSASKWLEFLYKNPRAMHGLLYTVDERLEGAARRNIESYLGAEQRIAKSLLMLESKSLGAKTEDGIALNFSQQELADLAGVSRESVSQVMRVFRHRDLIKTGRQVITICNLDTLRAVADGELTASY